MILNLAVGGDFLSGPELDMNGPERYILHDWAQPEMIVDYVRVYQRSGSATQVCGHEGMFLGDM